MEDSREEIGSLARITKIDEKKKKNDVVVFKEKDMWK